MARWFKVQQDRDLIYINREKIAVVKIKETYEEGQPNPLYVVSFIGQGDSSLFETAYAMPGDAQRLIEEFLISDEQY